MCILILMFFSSHTFICTFSLLCPYCSSLASLVFYTQWSSQLKSSSRKENLKVHPAQCPPAPLEPHGAGKPSLSTFLWEVYGFLEHGPLAPSSLRAQVLALGLAPQTEHPPHDVREQVGNQPH